jgi:hypothetical protein
MFSIFGIAYAQEDKDSYILDVENGRLISDSAVQPQSVIDTYFLGRSEAITNNNIMSKAS